LSKARSLACRVNARLKLSRSQRTSMNRLRRFRSDEVGATAVEYGLIAALIVVAIIAGLNLFATNAIGMFAYIDTSITTAMR
jgi:pilus assembly protein Flp/PilA